MAASQSSSRRLGANTVTVSQKLNENDRFGVCDLAASNHGCCLFQGRLDHFDVFSLISQAAALGHLVRRRVRAREEGDFLHDSGRAYAELEQPIHLLNTVAAL